LSSSETRAIYAHDGTYSVIIKDIYFVSSKAMFEEFGLRLNVSRDLSFFGARDQNRTGTSLSRPGILSPVRLPVSPPGRAGKWLKPIYQFTAAGFRTGHYALERDLPDGHARLLLCFLQGFKLVHRISSMFLRYDLVSRRRCGSSHLRRAGSRPSDSRTPA
jgi:hypothetical protein